MTARNTKNPLSYPPAHAERFLSVASQSPEAVIREIEIDSPAYETGFEPGCVLTMLNGKPLLDILDWRWRSDGDEITVSYIDNDGETGEVTLVREDNSIPWGFEFEDLIFDKIHECKNSCTFCFMRQLPDGMRPSLRLRDDDYRLSFLAGTFVTLTNISETDETRIIDQRISPLHVSLQAIDPTTRQNLMGRHAKRGIEVLEHLLQAGIECYCQIVLVPGVNDGDQLIQTLDWAFAQQGIVGIGIVPLGYTKHQTIFETGFDSPLQAEEVLELLKPFQERALEERGEPWVYAADEFYLIAYGKRIFELLPPAEFYGSFDMFEDGIGMVRSTLDEWEQAKTDGLLELCGKALERAQSHVYCVAGFAQQAFLTILMRDPLLRNRLAPLYVQNDYFGGNVDVTGLLTGKDIIRTLKAIEKTFPVGNHYIVLPRVIFNDEGVTLDDMTLEDISNQTELSVSMVSCSPIDYLKEIIELVE